MDGTFYFDHFHLGNIHVLRNQDFGFFDPPPPPFVITFSTERNQKLPFSDPPPPPFVIT